MTRWLCRHRPNPGARLRLLCFPHAGSGASIFRSWPGSLPPDVELCAVELPGRETRLDERPFERMSPLIDELLEALLPSLDRPFAIHGHSLGALIGFTFTRALRRRSHPLPVHLFVAAHGAPHLREQSPLWELPESQFIAGLRRLGGIPDLVLEEPELKALFLPILRADIAILEAEPFAIEPALDCPITAFGGLGDDRAGPDRLQAWQAHTKREFDLEMFPGGHFFPQKAATTFLASLNRRLQHILDRI